MMEARLSVGNCRSVRAGLVCVDQVHAASGDELRRAAKWNERLYAKHGTFAIFITLDCSEEVDG
jgi:hypothetical protein